MEELEFSILADELLAMVCNIIEDQDKEGEMDVDLGQGILNLVTQDGVFVINKHSVAREIWLSSPISGPFHFAFIGNKWLTKKGDNLILILEQELNINFAKI